MAQSYLIASERKVLLVELYLCQYKRCRTHQFENTKVIRVWRANTRAHCHDSASQWWLGSGVYHLSLFKVRQKKIRLKKNTGDKYQLTGSPLNSRPVLTFVCVSVCDATDIVYLTWTVCCHLHCPRLLTFVFFVFSVFKTVEDEKDFLELFTFSLCLL